MSNPPLSELEVALAEVGRLIEEMPHDERWSAVNDSLDNVGLSGLTGEARTFVMGVFVTAHQRRLWDEAEHA